MNMFARFDENPAMTLQDIKETKCYGRTLARTHRQRENSIPTTNKVCGGYNYNMATPNEFIIKAKAAFCTYKKDRGWQNGRKNSLVQNMLCACTM